ncbi:DnaB-like helicase C-terminal domain-containing protein [Mycolicibacterium mucogenicum]|uniref:DnaB-like helicase C-terminal domain-containing protein n=1 Tax=Mycolicibacterium mucogenicum TaxID=56689 RepID=UPI0026AC8D78|nr:DnaB-like helicase C-terminal domain-containing protein [Mycolicibacterium mucogenicum]
MWESLGHKGTRFLRGQLVLACAGPGTGKSAFILAYALKSGVPTLYFSADSDAFTQTTRSLSIVKEQTLERSAATVRNEDLDEIDSVFDAAPIRFNYNASPSLDQVETSLRAYDEVYGEYPELIVVDNITNVRAGGDNDDDPFSGLEGLMDYLHTVARGTEACVIGLHHVTSSYNDADKPIPLSGVKGQITRVPEMVLTLFRIASEFGTDDLNVSTVKNRSGRADPSGNDYVTLDFIGDSMSIKDRS